MTLIPTCSRAFLAYGFRSLKLTLKTVIQHMPMNSKALLHAALLLVTIGTTAVVGQGGPNFDRVEVEVKKVQGNVYMLTGAGGNVTVQIGDEGVLIVDTQFAPMAPKILAAVRTLSDKPIRYIANTHVHPDHSGGNEALAKAGGATIVGHENILRVMAGAKDGSVDDRYRQGPGAQPTMTFTDRRTIRFNGEDVELIHVPAAHSTGDTIVYFRGSNVISGGDVFAITRYPVVDVEGGGRVSGMINGLNLMATLSNPSNVKGRTYIVPGHGRLCDREDLVKYRDMSVILSDRVEAMIRKGMTLAQVIAAKPTAEYDPLYGASTGQASTESFIEDLYRSLTAKN
jgi:glyoxylase-like metal-dependent hydrolase (beta-lactamase superfamily II)